MADQVYLDHNATTPLRPEALEAMLPYLQTVHGNPSSRHRFGREAHAALDRARRQVAQLCSSEPDEVVFTGSGAEAVQLGVLGPAGCVSKPGHAVVSAIEHSAGIDAANRLVQAGWRVTFPTPDHRGVVSAESLEKALEPDTALVSVIHANNETGVIQPIEAIHELCRTRKVMFHTDAVQSAGRIPLPKADLVSVAAHKIGGPKGIGALIVRRDVSILPVFPGTQELGRRGGTVNVAGAAGFGAAAELVLRELPQYPARIEPRRAAFETALLEAVPAARVSGAEVPRLANTSHITFGAEGNPDIVVALDMLGFAVSSGSACTSGSSQPSHVLKAMGYSDAEALTAVRVSLGYDSTPQDCARLTAALKEVWRV